MAFPYCLPWEPRPHSYRIRRDHPDLEMGKDGKPKPRGKYLGAPGSTNRLYFPPGITREQLADITIPIIVVEGEKKALALHRLASHNSDAPRFIPIGISGVWNWRGTVGKTGGPRGERLDVKGPINDLGHIVWGGRKVSILFDADVHTNDSVKWARDGLCRELKTRDAEVGFVSLPEDCGVNGVDDLLALWGPDRVLELLQAPTGTSKIHVVQSSQFEATPRGLLRISMRGEQLIRTQLTNYLATITANICVDDGVEHQREFELGCELAGRRHVFTICARNFAPMDWPIEKMGAHAITYPNQKIMRVRQFRNSRLGRRIARYTATAVGARLTASGCSSTPAAQLIRMGLSKA